MNAALIEPGRKLVLRKARTARGGDGADIHQEFDAGIFKLVQNCLGPRLFITDGEELFRFARHIRIHSFAMSSAEGYVSPAMISITGQVMPEKPGAAGVAAACVMPHSGFREKELL
jgi:hypothetical protein